MIYDSTPMVNELEYLIECNYKKAIFKRLYDTIKIILFKMLITIRLNPSVWLKTKSKISYSKFTTKDKERFERVLVTALMIKRVSDVELIDPSGLVSDESKVILKEAEEYLLSLA